MLPSSLFHFGDKQNVVKVGKIKRDTQADSNLSGKGIWEWKLNPLDHSAKLSIDNLR
jgi:hypothetical protein